MLVYKNFAIGQLSENITNTSTQIKIQEYQRFPSSGSFRAVIWGNSYSSPLEDSTREIVELTYSGSGDVFNVNTGGRGLEGTTAKSWSINSFIALVLTAETLENINRKRRYTTTTTTSLNPDFSAYDIYQITSLSSNLTINNPTGNAQLGDVIVILIKDNGTSRTLTFGNSYKGMGLVLPNSTIANKTMEIICEYDGANWLTSYLIEV